ncbi:hypothetical protein KR222_007763 [Zaprionus bogoriensis]|nr:hypothetical protein KR222_007763 [Zaprionus bogoriensis]
MSRHSYLTTTVEYYEYLTPHNNVHNYESIFWPFPAATSTIFIATPHVCDSYSTDLQHEFVVPYAISEHSGRIFNMTECQQEPTIFEYSEQQEEPHCTQCQAVPDSEQDEDDQLLNVEKEFEYKNEDAQTSSASKPAPKSKQKPKQKNNVYQAEQGYLVEEPPSDVSEEDQDGAS